jgi:hypothetical protein
MYDMILSWLIDFIFWRVWHYCWFSAKARCSQGLKTTPRAVVYEFTMWEMEWKVFLQQNRSKRPLLHHTPITTWNFSSY